MPIDRLIAIASVILGAWVSWYFYSLSLPTRIPTFLVDPSRAVLAGGSPDITIQYKGKPIRQRAVNVVRVYFWNAGNTDITKTDILEPLTITVSDSEILDAKTLKVSRELTFISLDVQKDQQNTAELDFDILESNDGAALQITYAGPVNAELEFHGATKGARSPTIKVVNGFSKRILTPIEEKLARIKDIVSVLFLDLCYLCY